MIEDIDSLEQPAECYCADRHLVFDTEAEAIEAEAAVTLAMGFSGVTARWDVPRQCEDGRWIFAIPPSPAKPALEAEPQPDGETP